MTLTEITNRIAERLNLTSSTALARIKEGVRESYKQVLSGLGLDRPTRGIVSANAAVDYRYVTFYGAQKLYSVYGTDNRPLDELSVDEMRNLVTSPLSGTPRRFATTGLTNESVTIWIDTTPADIFTLYADALVNPAVLQDDDQPVLPDLYHDILVYGGKAIELRKMEKPTLAEADEEVVTKRLGELRLFLAKSAYRRIWQGKMAQSLPWYMR